MARKPGGNRSARVNRRTPPPKGKILSWTGPTGKNMLPPPRGRVISGGKAIGRATKTGNRYVGYRPPGNKKRIAIGSRPQLHRLEGATSRPLVRIPRFRGF